MNAHLRIFAALALVAAVAPLAAAPATFALVNATGGDITAMEARRTGTNAWGPVPFSAAAGASGAATFDTSDCAWDLRVTLSGGRTLTFANVNLCEARLLTLRHKDGLVWVDYD